MSKAKVLDNENQYPPIFGFLVGVFQENRLNGPILEETFELYLKNRILEFSFLGYGMLICLTRKKEYMRSLMHILTSKRIFSFYIRYAYERRTVTPLEQGPWVIDVLWGTCTTIQQ